MKGLTEILHVISPIQIGDEPEDVLLWESDGWHQEHHSSQQPSPVLDPRQDCEVVITRAQA